MTIGLAATRATSVGSESSTSLKKVVSKCDCNRRGHFELQKHFEPCKSSLLPLLISAVLPVALLCFAPDDHKDLLITLKQIFNPKVLQSCQKCHLALSWTPEHTMRNSVVIISSCFELKVTTLSWLMK